MKITCPSCETEAFYQVKATIRLLRVAKIPTSHLLSSAGLEVGAPISQAKEALKQQYAPFAPGLSIFWQEHSVTLVGMEVMAYSVDANQIPCAGIISGDPCIAEDVHRADGALQCELQRIGIWSQITEYEWRVQYETTQTRIRECP
jgi:hypothetical protein